MATNPVDEPYLPSTDIRKRRLRAIPLIFLPPDGCELDAVVRETLIEALNMTGWVQKDAAALLRVRPAFLSHHCHMLGISHPEGRWGHGGDRGTDYPFFPCPVSHEPEVVRFIEALRERLFYQRLMAHPELFDDFRDGGWR